MSRPATHLVLFDIDGTLLLSAGAGRRALTAAMLEEVPDPAVYDLVRFDGKTDPQIVRELLQLANHPGAGDAVLIETICRRYVSFLEDELRHPRTTMTVMPGVLPLLEELERQARVILGLLTGNVVQGAALKLTAAGIGPDRFAVGAYGSDSAYRPDLPAIAARRAEPHFGREPRGSEVIIIGDTPADVTCGQGISARAIGVATGSYSIESLAAAGAHAAFPDLSDTTRVLEAILGE
ncbi:MAG TPA: HAD hydrolase-like protein [Gemmatimonadales bacterium]|nr:HAD hydrolase-like protein [Gemmatimonadales bacterium]